MVTIYQSAGTRLGAITEQHLFNRQAVKLGVAEPGQSPHPPCFCGLVVDLYVQRGQGSQGLGPRDQALTHR
jgi:hypothetical protein